MRAAGTASLTACTLRSSSLGSIHGIPRVHYKGRQGDYYVMVRPPGEPRGSEQVGLPVNLLSL